jgi:hypothetical protein
MQMPCHHYWSRTKSQSLRSDSVEWAIGKSDLFFCMHAWAGTLEYLVEVNHGR